VILIASLVTASHLQNLTHTTIRSHRHLRVRLRLALDRARSDTEPARCFSHSGLGRNLRRPPLSRWSSKLGEARPSPARRRGSHRRRQWQHPWPSCR
jgi:hypothetical protein